MMRRLTVDSRMLGAAFLAAIAAVVVLSITRPPETTDVAVVSGPVAAGTRVGEAPLALRPVSDATGLVTATDIEALTDHVLLVSLEAGTPLVRAVLDGPDADAFDVIGLELESAAAVHGVLAPGDAVDVYLDTDPSQPVATAVTVVGVFADSGSFGTGDVGLLLAVDGELAPIIVGASSGDSIRLVRRGG